MSVNFKIGEPVWARMKSWPPWPAKVVKSDAPKKGHVYVYFFGNKPQHGWVMSGNVTAFDQHKEKLSNVSNKTDFKEALKQIEEYKESWNPDESEDNITEEIEGEENTPETPSAEGKRKRKPNKKFSDSDSEASTVAKPRGKRKTEGTPSSTTPTGKKSRFSGSLRTEENGVSSKPDLSRERREEILNMEVPDRPETPPLDLNSCSELIKTKDIEASTLKFGFLGLGIMGSGMVKNLINSGHSVNLWSRNTEKCNTFKQQADANGKEELVNTFLAPCDVRQSSDIIFSCVADPKSAEAVAFGNCGVVGLHEDMNAMDGKGYVEMTGIDPHTSQKIAEVIRSKGGRYLEAQLQGSKQEADEGSLVILTAGDKSLFMDCQSCFKAMGKTALYLGDVGVASKVYLILQVMKGISLIGLAEGLVLADRCGISAKDILNIFDMTNLSCPYLINKANIIMDKDFKRVEHSIQHMQKDIKMALDLSDQMMQPLMMASTANEVYKHSRKLGYDEHDCSCVYMRTRY